MIEVANARLRYDALAGRPALTGTTCTISPGELVCLAGPNGSGKSTLAALMCAMRLADDGEVRIDGLDARIDSQRREARRRVGFVRQSAADQMVASIVEEEVAFGPRNLGLAEADIEHRVERALRDVGLIDLMGRDVRTLSGGEQQRVALAGVLAMEPRYVVLDEVTSNLDVVARATARALFRRLARERDIGVVQITHDPLEAVACDRVLLMERGRLAWQGPTIELLIGSARQWDQTFSFSGYIDALRVAIELGYPLECGSEPTDLLGWLQRARANGSVDRCGIERILAATAHPLDGGDRPAPAQGARVVGARGIRQRSGEALISLADVSYAYGRTEALSHVNVSVSRGEVLLLAGRSGSGKSTLAALAAGLATPHAGEIRLGVRYPRPGDVGYVLQAPEQQLFCDSVEAELAFAPMNRGVSRCDLTDRVHEAAARMGLDSGLLPRDPFSLSGGQARKVGIASVLSLHPAAIVLDEPSCGLDARARDQLHRLVRALANEGMAIMVISHDLEEWLVRVDRVALLEHGELRWHGSPQRLAGEPSLFARAGLAAPESWVLRDALLAALAVPIDAVDPSGASSSESSSDARVLPMSPPSRPRRSALASVDERVKIILLLAASAAVFFADAPWMLAVWCAMLACILRCADVSARGAIAAIRPTLALLVLIACANLVSCDGSADIRVIGFIGLSRTGGVRALVCAARLVVIAGFSFAVAQSTTPTRIAAAAARLARPLARAGAPVAALALSLSIALRCIPIVGDELTRIRRAQLSRGARFEEGVLGIRARAWISVLTPLMVGLLRRSDRLAESVDARCYADAARAMPAPRSLGRRDAIALGLGSGLIALLVAARFFL
ncbi:ABC transporter related protein [Coriobacterium glomerans PW2]|uniref:ABC transporter related protein n=1 Tax=Coriobacterium glomerans (strain ATCC 49209 / DSM 20642 / JCM 10262 / PW2) TaxID=700015 RepID=F2N8L8_CORGP|nr:energy-coupling factor transporter ATPase [Coriobacterium glomerans]AEB07401.1 ABC transporter related protein [Coriobacterium glomerans PW2]